MTGLEQLCLTPKGAHQCGASLHRAQVASCAVCEMAEISSAEVRHRVVFEISPDVFDRIELRRIGGQELKSDRTTLSLNMLTDKLGAMGLQTIPDDQQLLADRGLKGLQELDHLRRADRAATQSEVETPEGHCSDHRELLPAEAVLKDRSLAPWGPGACATRSLRQSRLIDEDDDSALSRRYFFSSGHLRAFQVRIAFSSRCRAWPVGRCTLQPSARSSRHTEGSVSSTAKRCSMRVRIRGSVHSSVAKPAANAPIFSPSISSSHCASESRRGRPKRLGRLSASAPPSCLLRSHLETELRVVPTRRATSACATPASSSRAARLRRRSNSINRCAWS